MTKKSLFLLMTFMMLIFASCLNNDNEYEDYQEWYKQNIQYVADAEALKENGSPVYTKVVPDWDPSTTVLLRWHNNRPAPDKRFVPLSNSTCNVKYMLRSIEGDTLDSSYSLTASYGDSLFQCKPNEMITGFHAAITNMSVGDSVTAVVPYYAGYGMQGSGSIKPFSTLIFEIKLAEIVAWDKK